MLKYDLFVNVFNHNYIYKVPLHFFKIELYLTVIMSQLYDLKYFYIIQIIYIQLYGVKYSYPIQIICTQLYDVNQLIGLVGRVFAHGLGDLGSIPSQFIPKTLKMVLDTSLLNTQQYKVLIKGKVE